MFSPTSFPAAAWRVTEALNVLPVTVDCKYFGYSDVFRSAKGAAFYATELFATREEAVVEAQAKLADDEAQVAQAIDLHARRRAIVKGLTTGVGK